MARSGSIGTRRSRITCFLYCKYIPLPILIDSLEELLQGNELEVGQYTLRQHALIHSVSLDHLKELAPE